MLSPIITSKVTVCGRPTMFVTGIPAYQINSTAFYSRKNFFLSQNFVLKIQNLGVEIPIL